MIRARRHPAGGAALKRMSKPHQLSDYTEFLPKTERRNPLPITNLPVNAISQDTDPTLEIRTLIEQLQQTARDSRTQARSFEQERDALAINLARAEQQIEALRANERELRSHFVEVTTLIKERDTALDESERRGHALAEAMRKNEAAVRERGDAQRQRDDAVRQRDEAMRKFETFSRSSEEHARLITETQKQLLTIRQARDGAHAQILELNNKLGATEDQLAETEYQRDAAQKSLKQASTEAADFRRQVDIVTTDRDATAKQVETLSAELDAQRQKYLDLAEQKSAAQAADGEHVAALAEARAQLSSLTVERDAARTRAQEQARELEELRVQFQAFRDESAKTSGTALDEAREKIATLEAQARETRHDGNNLRQKLELMGEHLANLQKAAEGSGAQQKEALDQLAAIEADRDAALTSLLAAQKQIDHIIRDRDQIRQLSTENAIELEAQLTALQAQVAKLDEAAKESDANKRQVATLNARFEKQRVETIDLATQLQAAQREVRELSASLAEARLQVKFASAANRAAKDGRTRSDFASLLPEAPAAAEPVSASEPVSVASEAPEVGRPTPPPAPIVPALAPLGLEEPLTEKESKSTLGAMRHCFQSFTKTPSDLSLLNELHTHVEGFAERARVSGLIALHRLCTSFADLTHGLYQNPELVNPSTLRTVHQTIEFLASLLKEKNLAQVKDPAKALIYAVDDDLGNCDSIALAMEESGMRTTCAQDPGLALAELAGGRYDLIFLDVNMPGMDGFELCKQIRTLAIHDKTPIVFLTGLATLENRVQSSLSGGNDFIAKPFNLHELSVKAITLILKAQLQLA
jgi:CheY-like chemotaxis protein